MHASTSNTNFEAFYHVNHWEKLFPHTLLIRKGQNPLSPNDYIYGKRFSYYIQFQKSSESK